MPEYQQDFENFPTEHAYRHKLPDDARESLAHIVLFPEQGIAGFIYPAVMGNGDAKLKAALFGRGLPEPVTEDFEGKAPADMNFDDFRLGPIRMAVTEPYKRVELEWNGDRIKFAGEIEMIHPAYPFSMHPGGNPPYFGDNRTEQHGRMRSKVEIDGRKFDYDGFMIRDHSWGPRIWGLNQHYKWIHATTGESSLHMFEMQSFGRSEIRGFLFKDGMMRHIEKVDCDYELDDGMLQRNFTMRVTDTDGRDSVINMQPFGHIKLDFDPTYIIPAPSDVTFDGKPGVGWCEFNWNKSYFDYAQVHAGKYG